MVIKTQRDNNDASALCLFIHYIQMQYPLLLSDVLCAVTGICVLAIF